MLDVTDVLFDPDWVQAIVAFTNEKSVSSVTGKTIVTEIPIIGAEGVIQPTKQDVFDQYPQLDRTKEHITVWSTTRFNVGVTIITWKGANYLIRVIKDWTDYGVGFQRCIAQRLELQRDATISTP